MIPVLSNSLGEEELNAVEAVFKSRWLGKGKYCERLENSLADFWGVGRAILFNCCTSAIFAAVRALGISKGDEVIISTVNFSACASAVLCCGGTPVFADVDPETLNILPSEIERLRTSRTKGVIILHYGGHPAPFDEIREASAGLSFILEDSANAVASKYKGRSCGTLGTVGVFSFDAMKI